MAIKRHEFTLRFLLLNVNHYCMTKAQLNAAAKAAREYRARHPAKAKQASKAWKARNPDWWKGRKYVQLLTSALVNGNANSKVFRYAGMTLHEWKVRWVWPTSFSPSHLPQELSNGSKLTPIKSWREFDLSNPDQVKAFLAPGNFKLVSK